MIKPVKVHAGEFVELRFKGAQPEEVIVFVIVSPGGFFTGPPHTASTSGTVTTSYQPALDAPPGTYVVTAKGSLFTTAQATFEVRPAVP